jgi:hypothetical protein
MKFFVKKALVAGCVLALSASCQAGLPGVEEMQYQPPATSTSQVPVTVPDKPKTWLEGGEDNNGGCCCSSVRNDDSLESWMCWIAGCGCLCSLLKCITDAA